MKNYISFEIKKNTGIIKLQRPQALNALNLEMADLFLIKLNEWQNNNTVERILLLGEGKAFCAGGDIKSMFLSTQDQNLKKEFLFKEYTLNYEINKFTKPYLSIWNGIVMGGGVGLSIYGSARIATEKTKFAMPETAIGFFPDVGGSYFLTKIIRNVGLYLGLTGQVMNFEEVVFFDLATHYFNSEKIEKVISKYINDNTIIKSENINNFSSEIIDNLNYIEDTFHGDIISIFERLKKSSHEFGKKNFNHLLNRCPMSLAITSELLHRAKKLSLKECLEMEYQLSQYMVYRDDFNNGVDSVLVSKTHKSKWNPVSIYDITNNDIDNFFTEHTEPLNLK